MNCILKKKLHVLHLNIRCFLKNSDKLKMMLDNFQQNKITIDVILICESFVNDLNCQFVHIPGYQCYFRNRDKRPGGGILIFVRNTFKVLGEIESPFNEITKSLFLKVKIGKQVVYFWEIYRIPNTDVLKFINDCKWIFESIKNVKHVFIGSDHNLDLLKANLHKHSSRFLEELAISEFVTCIT